MKAIVTLLFVALSAHCMAQGIAGKVLDEHKEPIINAVVRVYSSGGILVGGNVTDYDGNYMIRPLEPGNYTTSVICKGYDTSTVTGIIVIGRAITTQNFALSKVVDGAKNNIKLYKK